MRAGEETSTNGDTRRDPPVSDSRYDAQRKKRFKTWEPPRPHFAGDQIVGLRVAFTDTAVRIRAKEAGGTWNPDRRVWQLRYGHAVALGLMSRIVDDPASTAG